MLSGSSQFSIVSQTEGRKKPIYEYELTHYRKLNTHHFLLVHIRNGLMRIRNGVFL